MNFDEKVEFILNAHREINHKYAGYLPYEFHLKLAETIGRKFMHNIPLEKREIVSLGIFGHDLLEDTHLSYNDIKSALGLEVADIIYDLTNEKGKTRKERANDKYYEGIRKNPLSIYIKLCDRIANVEFGKLMRSRQVEMYRKENSEFVEKLKLDGFSGYDDMFNYLESLFK